MTESESDAIEFLAVAKQRIREQFAAARRRVIAQINFDAGVLRSHLKYRAQWHRRSLAQRHRRMMEAAK